jgi:hypothetical protein
MHGLFISYRRHDSPGHVGRLYDLLVERFGADHVFMDFDNIRAGEDFVNVLNQALASCRVLLAVIGPQWLNAPGANGRRLDAADDFVRLELRQALQRNVHVIPVLVGGAQIPTSTQLPQDIQALSRRQSQILEDRTWKHDTERLVEEIERVIGRSRKRWRLAMVGVSAAILATIIVVGTSQFWRPVGPGRVLFEDDFVSQRRVTGPQKFSGGPNYCAADYVQDGLLVEARDTTDSCEYVLYDAPFMPDHVRIEISIRLRQPTPAVTQSAYGVRLAEAKPDDPDSPLAYRAAIVRVDDFNVTEGKPNLLPRVLLAPNLESSIRAGQGNTNVFAVEVHGQTLRWELNGRDAGTIKARVPLSGAVSTYVTGQGLKAVFSNLKITSLQP